MRASIKSALLAARSDGTHVSVSCSLKSGLAREAFYGFVGSLAKTQRRGIGTEKRLRSDLGAGFRTKLLKMFKRGTIFLVPQKNRCRLVVRFIIGRIKLEDFQDQAESFDAYGAIGGRGRHLDAAEVEIGADQFRIVGNRLGKCLAGRSGVALLNFDNSKQVFDSPVVGILAGGFRDFSTSLGEILCLDLFLNLEDGALVCRGILTGNCVQGRGCRSGQRQRRATKGEPSTDADSPIAAISLCNPIVSQLQ